MGEVYLAEDTRLKRKVALKLLTVQFAKDADRLRRFEREAHAVSALNHPNIVTLFDLGQVEEQYFLTTEYIDGRTLRAHLQERGQLPIREAIEIALQIVSALSAAHAAGITHRDIKPENVMVRHDAYVKVLDFGLAKVNEVDTGGNPEKVLSSLTTAGAVMGTVSYMSPEQARGLRVDARTDIFSLGVMLYEMLTGKRPFTGTTASDIVASILRSDPPPLTEVLTEAPAELQRIVSKALRKDRDERYQLVREMMLDLKSLKQELEFEAKLKNAHSSAEYVVSQIKRHPLGVGIALVIFLAAVTGLAFGLYRLNGQRQSPGRASGPSPRVVPFTSFPGNECCPSFSPDGNQIAFVWDGGKGSNADIYVKLIDAESPVQLTTNPAADTAPAWSPDGRHIAFVRSRKNETGIFIITALGGSERALYLAPSGGATISPGLVESPAGGATISPGLAWSPDGKLLAFSERDSPQEPNGIFLLSLESREKTRLTSPPAGGLGDYSPAFSPDGKTVAFKRGGISFFEGQVYLVPITGGTPKRLIEETGSFRPGDLAWTVDGRELVFTMNRTNREGLWRISVPGDTPEQLAVAGNDVYSPAISCQRNRLAYTQYNRDTDIWHLEAPRSSGRTDAPAKLIVSTFQDHSPRYSPDGKRIVFRSTRSGSPEIYVCESDGSNLIKLTSFGGSNAGSPSWSPDGRQIAFDGSIEGSYDIYVINASGGKPRRLTADPSVDARPSWSRDGQWVYFGSNRSGTWQVWKSPSAGGPAAPVTQQGGYEAFESADGKFLYYTKSLDLNPSLKPSGIWRMPATGGVELRILDQVRQGYWAVLEQGLYFLNTKASPHTTIEFFSFATARRTQLAVVEKEFPLGTPGFAVSPDGRWMLLALIDQSESDIMLMENFR